ncbi:aminodeoxychorismate lyase [Algicola sagamiensis]|uniref:aminodeoxychorismate lyase n=1 Tax=Algicola sagamiensis TaxID=163869 RepID=UPI0003671F61|nr:aminodeoxychorismate lyase [Algicola sagamiensis]
MDSDHICFEDKRVSLRDRAFNYGDGLFTTLLYDGKKLHHWDAHVARFQHGLAVLSIPEPNWQTIYQAVLSRLSSERQVVKIHISRGCGGRGYACGEIEGPDIRISFNNFPKHYEMLQMSGVGLITCNFQLSIQPFLAGLKHLNRLEQVMIRQELDAKNAFEGIVCDYNGDVIECCSANIFWYSNGVWFTPELSECGVKGIMRGHVIRQLQENAQSLQIGRFGIQNILSAESVWICNSLMGIVPVFKVDQQAYDVQQATELSRRWLSA